MTSPSMAYDTFLGKPMRAARTCVYCGSVWDLGRDHVIPTSYLRAVRRFAGDWIAPCCSSCNGTLGGELLFNIPDRAAWVAEVLRRKHRKLLQSVQWEKDEIDGLGYNLKIIAEKDKAQRAELARRIAHLDIVARMSATYMSDGRPMIHLNDEEVLEFIEDDSYAASERRRVLIMKARRKYAKSGYDR